MVSESLKMENSFRLALLAITCALASSHGVAVAAPAPPVVSVSNDGKRAIARYGIADDALRQSQLAVKELSFLIKKYPDAKNWAVAYNTAPELWRVLEYDIERRQLMEVVLTKSEKSNRRGNDFFPAHIHRAAQQSLNIEELWKSNKAEKRTN